MREDMFKVIVERPRTGGVRRKGVHADVPDGEDSPSRQALHKYRRTKFLNENLSPLERYLHAQVGRPWDRVFADICERIDGRSAVQRHILQHIGDFVAVNVREEAGRLVDMQRPRTTLDHRYASRLYVDPRTGVLRINKFRERTRATERKQRQQVQATDRRALDHRTELQRIDGLWYEVRFEPLSASNADAMVRLAVLPQAGCCGRPQCAGRTRVACAKRQLGRTELKRHGLDNDKDE